MSADDAAYYLGDGAYARVLSYGVELYTSNGIHETNNVVMEPEVLDRFLKWLSAVQEMERH